MKVILEEQATFNPDATTKELKDIFKRGLDKHKNVKNYTYVNDKGDAI